MSENSALRTLLHFVAEDLGVADKWKDRNPVQLTTAIRKSIATRDARIAELEAALKELQTEFFAHQEDPQRSVTYKWSLTRIGYALSGSPSALDALLAQARREAGEECARIASDVSSSYGEDDGFPSLHAVGAETVAVTIRARFGLDDRQMAREVKQ